MQIELTAQAQEVVERLLAEGKFANPDEAVEYALHFFEDCQPTTDSLKVQLQEGLDDVVSGRVGPLDIECIKRRGREHLAARRNADPDV